MNDVKEPERNATFEKFGGVETLVRDYRYWSLQVRPVQATLGAMILLAHGPAQAFGDLPAEAHAELAKITADIETRLRDLFRPEKFNYLMLMMVDPHVHFHVLPRYSAAQTHAGLTFEDPGWPAVPDLTAGPGSKEATARVRDTLREAWSG